MKEWLEHTKYNIETTSYCSYKGKVDVIAEYFNNLGITLQELKRSDLKLFYQQLAETHNIKPQSVRRYHANIHKALNEAVELGLIMCNPSDNVKLEKSEQFIGDYYNQEELKQLFEVSKGSNIELHILLASHYGLRREEVCGLRWSNIDFENDKITIAYTVTQCTIDGVYTVVSKSRTKNTSSYRTLPLIPSIKERLLEEKTKQEENKKIFGNRYLNDKGFVCVTAEGKSIRPNSVTQAFRRLLQKNNLKKIRFHDLRHSCASLLLQNGIHMKEIQQWLGHSNYNTTANIYSHVDSGSKLKSANVIADVL